MTARMPLTPSQLQELWLGPSYTRGSMFASREELRAAWEEHRAEVMMMSKPGNRPAAWYEFERPPGMRVLFGDDHEASTLWRAGVLDTEERLEVEQRWRAEFDKAFKPIFDVAERRKRFDWADIPDELVRAWTAERGRSAKTIKKLETENAPAAGEEELRRR